MKLRKGLDGHEHHLCVRPVRHVDAGQKEGRRKPRFPDKLEKCIDKLLFSRLERKSGSGAQLGMRGTHTSRERRTSKTGDRC
jgi:hypothetical protein